MRMIILSSGREVLQILLLIMFLWESILKMARPIGIFYTKEVKRCGLMQEIVLRRRADICLSQILGLKKSG